MLTTMVRVKRRKLILKKQDKTLALLSMQVLERIKDPLMTLVSRDHHETAYAVLAHFLIIAQRAPLIFASVRPTPVPLFRQS